MLPYPERSQANAVLSPPPSASCAAVPFPTGVEREVGREEGEKGGSEVFSLHGASLEGDVVCFIKKIIKLRLGGAASVC